MKHIMNDVSQAIKVAISVRDYLQENTGGSNPPREEFIEKYQRISRQIKNVSGL